MEQYTGFSLTFSAVDLNECEDPAQNNCSHFCSNYIGGYFCSCRPGYLLLPDKHTCAVIDCGPPTNIDNGLVIFNQTTHRSEATYSCASEYYTPASGDGTFRCPSNGLWANKDGGQELPRCVPVCGIFKPSQTPRGRIFGGQIAEPGQFPWQIAFVSPSRGCGALISDRWILTAAHVVQDKESPEMYGGVINLRHKKQENLLKAKKIIVHPSWITQENEDRVSYNHDIALILLCSKVKLGPLISPICLPGSDHGMSPTLYQRAYIAGWGATEKKERTVNLLFTTVSLSKIEKCQELNKEEKYIFTSNMLCAGDANGHDSCKGDDGGPLMVFQDGRMYTAGITSWGVNCGKFGVYTKVENYMDWIKETMERVEMEEDGSPDPECA
ncbi:complement C1s subcomponent [Pelobates cultripes]|nr:complement C1s subcomponent [Pelobates cultripes]